jgi:putative effector of murein hydrolase LrgA (UPF0299 family)
MSAREAKLLFVASLVAALLQGVGLLRYVERIPQDWVGIGLYIVTALTFVLAAFGFYTHWRRTPG